MKKLKLDPDALVVESFDAVTAAAGEGTVQGLAYTPACDSIRICLPTNASYDPCAPSETLQCTGSCQNTECGYGGTCTCT